MPALSSIAAGAIVAGGVASAAGTIIGANKQADAATAAGNAQVAAAKQQVDLAKWGVTEQEAQRAKSLSDISAITKMTPEEISSISQIFSTRDSALTAGLNSISQQQAQLNAADPQVKAAGKNLLDLLSGKSADMLAPLQTQRGLQRQQLMNNLSAQMGPGFMTSTAGIQALTAFDQDTASVMSTAQLQAVNQATSTYLGTAGLQQQGQNAITSQTGSVFNAAETFTGMGLQAFQQNQSLQLSGYVAGEGANPINYGAPAAAQGAVVNTAGNPFVGQAISGAGTAAAFGQIGGGLAGAANTMFLGNILQGMGQGNGGGGGESAPLTGTMMAGNANENVV